MQVTWETEDIEAGRVVRSQTDAKNRNLMIGYKVTATGNDWCLFSLSDGLIVTADHSKNTLASYMNRTELLPTDSDPRVRNAADILAGRV